MGPMSAIVLFAVVWFMVFFIVLPLRLETQGDVGEVVPGTHAGAPANLQMKKKVKTTSIWALGIWVVLATIIWSGLISVRDIDWFDRMTPIEESQTTDGTDG
ncbi:Predicted secreted protein [Cognatiyoonia koreensis]|uniref:Predicted secreted protein n=1 Tax=Cognatiyoonia koreensis TaxID=364200 RepID=A0A1I0N2U2_9RHOB|nr:DUF1467 family protein [Cognatiyoonia koreensis]SEV95384.1 Predicted secreted protein [Cognatiyoonia koreensis]